MTAAVSTVAKREVTTWRYHLRGTDGVGSGWCVAFLDDIGVFSYVSDYGEGGHRWPQDGWGPRGFREFFLSADDDYVLRKIARRDVYDGEETYKSIRQYILETRRERSRSRLWARTEWDRLESYGRVSSREDFAMWYEGTQIDEAYEYAVYTFPGDALGFMKHVMPRLRAAIKAQLDGESAV